MHRIDADNLRGILQIVAPSSAVARGQPPEPKGPYRLGGLRVRASRLGCGRGANICVAAHGSNNPAYERILKAFLARFRYSLFLFLLRRERKVGGD